MSGKEEKMNFEIPSHLSHLSEIETLSEEIATKMELSEDQRNNLAIAVTEAVGNAITHGNKNNPEKKVRIEFILTQEIIKVSISDEGEGFEPDTLSDPLDPANMMKESGRGIFILKALMDEVSFTDDGRTINFTMIKKKV